MITVLYIITWFKIDFNIAATSNSITVSNFKNNIGNNASENEPASNIETMPDSNISSIKTEVDNLSKEFKWDEPVGREIW